ncbi:MAG TPA: class I SAM-dependent methyltransferase [Nannocystis exedens]|nr:class I SAM-dependent methyltransferase [Nannocystis exedens]
MNSEEHWQRAWTGLDPEVASWHAEHLEVSLAMIAEASLGPAASIIDVGGGASTLPRDLLAAGYQVTVLDIAKAAISASKRRLCGRAEFLSWIVGDITKVSLPSQNYDLWHDRAVFHFLTEQGQRQAYRTRLLQALRPAGQVVISTFADDGPRRCSGLEVRRYSPEALLQELGPAFEGLDARRFTHLRPDGESQRFIALRARLR